MPDAPAITVCANGPYLVSGVPLGVKQTVETSEGEPIAWAMGPDIGTDSRYLLCRCGSSTRKPFCDGSHARVGFVADDVAAGSYDDRSKIYEGPGIVVGDDRSICVHAGFCGTKVTNVWKMVRHSGSTDVRSQMIAMIERCPSGALTYRFEGSSRDNEPDLATRVAVIPDGPLLVTGAVSIACDDGELIETRPRVTLCRCGGSHNKPLCDGTHKDIGFRHQP